MGNKLKKKANENLDDIEDEKTTKILELTDLIQRLQAEFENFKKRSENEKQNLIKVASKDMILKILPVVDNFELALNNSTCSDSQFSKGIEMIYAQLIQVLNEEGVEIIDTSKNFDPNLHEALLAVESDKESGAILEELQKGYLLNNIVLRHSKVKVAK